MGFPYPVRGVVRVGVLIALTVLISSLTPAHVGRAQSPVPPLIPWRGLVDHVSVNLWGSSGYSSADLADKSISADGRYVVFTSSAYDLVPDDYNWNEDVFLRDRLTGITTRISIADDGSEALGGMSEGGTISADGRHVAFQSGATNLVAGDTNNVWDVFVRDLDTNHTARVSIATDGTQTDADSYFPSLSPDGRFVVFASQATTLAPGQLPYQPGQVYVHDRDFDGNGIFDEPGGIQTTLVSLSATGANADAWCQNVRVSANGRIVMFESSATNLFYDIPLDGTNHLYVHDRDTGQTTMIDRAVTGGPSAYGVESGSSDMSDDGRFITYATESPDIVLFDMNWNAQVIRHDRADSTTGADVLVTRRSDGVVGDGTGYFTSVSGDGRYVAFQSTSSNLATPAPQSGHGSVIVRDMDEGTFTRVDVLSDGTGFNHSYPYNPSISADGSAVAFNSDATNTGVPGNPWGSTQHAFTVTGFAVQPTFASYPTEGGAGVLDVNTTAVSGWTAASLDPWIVLTDGAGFGAGPRTVNYIVDSNGTAIVRDGRIQLGSTIVTIHQEGDGDITPPVITPIVTGTQVNGWYTSDVTVHWDISDPESAFVVNEGCYDSAYTTDFAGATPYCRATSHGGTSYAALSLRRDTTAPTVSITSPYPTAYPLGATITPAFSCADGGGSGIASCTIASPIDTSTPGRKLFTVTATDFVAKSSAASVEYIVGTGVCVAPNENLKARFTFDGHTGDEVGGLYANPVPYVPVYYDPGISGQSVHFQGDMYLAASATDGRLSVGEGLTIAAWVASGGYTIPYSTIVASPGQYTVAVFPDTSLRWRFNLPTGFDWVDTGVKLPRRGDVFTHVAITYAAGLVNTYINGRLVHTKQLEGVVQTSGDTQSINIGGSPETATPLWGAIDDLGIYTAALTASEIDALALAGSGTVCPPQATTLELVVESPIGYMSEMPVSAQLLDASGQPLAGRQLAFYVYFSPDGKATAGRLATTDANGKANTTIQLYSNSVIGSYPNGVAVFFDGNARYQWATTRTAATVVRGTPQINWTAPPPITYGTALGAQQLNATATISWLYQSIPGTFTYSPAAGTKLDAGLRTLSVTFTPDDLANWRQVTSTTTVQVNKAAPTLSIGVGTYTYDKQPHAATVTATGVNAEALAPVQVFYNGSQTAPTNAGSYSVSASYAGSANYTSGSKTSSTQLVIRKYVPTVQMSGGPYTYDAQQHSPTISVRGAGGDYLSPFGYFFDGWTSTIPVNAGTHSVQVQYNGDSNYEGIVVTDLSFVINKATPLIWMSSSNRYYDGNPQVTPAWASGVGSESLTPVVVTYNGSTTPPTGVGSYALAATYNGSANYNAVSTTATMTILQGTPWLTWANPAAIVYGTPLGGAQLNATAPTPGRFYYAQPAGTVLPAGTQALSVLFVPDDQTNWSSANKSVSVTVLKATPTVSWPQPAELVYGAALGPAQLNATSSVPGTYTYSPSAGAVLPAGSHTLSVTFTPDDAANYNSAAMSVVLNVAKAAPTITWVPPADVTYGTPLSALQLNVDASVPGTYEFSPAVGTILPAGSHTLTVVFTPTDSANYSDAAATVTLNVAKASAALSWGDPAGITYGTALSAAQLNATASAPGTFTYSPSAGTLLPAGTHTLSVTFTPDDVSNYTGGTGSVTLNVTKASTTVSWGTPGGIVYGTPLGAGQLNATASVPGTFTYAPAPGTVLNAGTTTLHVTFTPADSTNYTGSSALATLTVAPAALTVRANDGTKAFGQPLPTFTSTFVGLVNGDTPGSLSGALVYSTPATSVSPVGAYPITPSGLWSPNYSLTFVNGTLAVVRASTVLTAFAAPDPVGLDQPVTFNASVALAAPGAGTPTGIVQFFDGGTLVGSGALTGGPVALTTAGLGVGAHTLTATYSGDDSFAGSSSTASFTVNTAAASSSAAVSSSPNPSNPGQAVTFTAAVSGPAGSVSGIVDFYDGATLIGSAPIAGTTATFTTASLAVGGHAITARFGGNANVPPSVSAPFGHTVQTAGTKPRATTTTVAASPSTAPLGGEVALTATVTGSQNRTPTGTVLFVANGAVIGSASVTATGSITAAATLRISTLPHGAHTIGVVYLADSNYRASAGTTRAAVN